MLGIGAIIGTGIFVLTGKAGALTAGPALCVSFLLAAVCCLRFCGPVLCGVRRDGTGFRLRLFVRVSGVRRVDRLRDRLGI